MQIDQQVDYGVEDALIDRLSDCHKKKRPTNLKTVDSVVTFAALIVVREAKPVGGPVDYALLYRAQQMLQQAFDDYLNLPEAEDLYA